MQWYPLKDTKESNPVQVAEYYVAKNIASEHALSWWVPYTINKRNVIIAAIKSYLKVATHKYGADISTSIGHTISLDNINGNRLCKEALEKDMHNVSIAFEIIPTGATVPVGWKKSSGHLIWYVNMDFTQKSH